MNEELESKVEGSETDTARLRRILTGKHDLRQYLHDMTHDLNNTLTCIIGYAGLINSHPENIENYCEKLIEEAIKAAALVHIYSLKSGSQMFIESIKHNFNNTLASILGFAQMCKANPGKKDEYSAMISRQVEATAELVKRLQEFTYASNQKNTAPVDINCAIDSALKEFSGEAKKKIVLEHDGNLLFAKTNSDELRLVYRNLVQNALDAHSEKITINSYVQNGAIFTQIRDDGYGITEDDFKKIFEPFFSKHNTVGHLGLGLATSKRIVEKYGGRILVESHIREGSIFTVELPTYEKKS